MKVDKDWIIKALKILIENNNINNKMINKILKILKKLIKTQMIRKRLNVDTGQIAIFQKKNALMFIPPKIAHTSLSAPLVKNAFLSTLM